MQTIVIGFGYAARQGKDTAVQAIVDARGTQYDIKLYPFAKVLKEEFYEACQNPFDAFWEFLFKKFGKTARFCTLIGSGSGSKPNDKVVLVPKPSVDEPTWEQVWQFCEDHKQDLRWLLQVYGTDYRRNQDPFYWVRKTGEAIKADAPQFALIPDLRFLNEAFFIKANDGYTVKVSRHGYQDPTLTGHISESQLANYEFNITLDVLDGELDQLKIDAVTLFDLICEWNTVPEYTTNDFTEKAMGQVNG